ncbi:CLC_0170 family protein [Clostridium sp. Cult3]|uniref:CLC_0170 family protein n=1 Tax=Clostridium sp. Cult3 TaxID=2079004 RepID=UPI001F1F34B0|nr:CLC_0170 family protein [Clostridium sp. Cult3]MCF6459482.1 hypothetical protein [Clostridium sp. Cult3]
MYGFIRAFRSIFDNFTLLFIIFIGLATLFIDGPRSNNQGFKRELTIVKFISYSYVVFGIIMFIIFKLI